MSTLKLNARVLRDLELISVEDHSAVLTESGREVILLLHEHLSETPPIQEVNA